ncbi:MAG TPA: transglutaminaseTgpA domain-containing protein, partial [Tepidisphaeraceae bacterium]|nr:transglutaminaseTgpA domain-containing protein [Tepidisphaeraceae bacterium]
MQEVSQFKTTLYVVVLLGLAAFGIAAQAVGFWAVCSAAVILHIWLSGRGKFRPLPRMYANLITIGTLLYVIRDYMVNETITPVLIVGEFLVLLQIVKLWELRTNRDYVQLLVVGLLLMVSASIGSSSLLYCVFLAVWLLVALYCCLLFHLKVESDRARLVLGISPEKYDADTLLDDQRELPRSTRRLTFCAAGVGAVFAVVVFLFFPRVNGAGFFGQFQGKAAQALVGFSEEVSFQNVAKLQANDEPIAYVSLTHNGQPVNGTQPLVLRGTTLDRYAGKQAPSTRRYHWIRSLLPMERGSGNYLTSREEKVSGPNLVSFRINQRRLQRSRAREPAPAEAPQADTWIEDITLRPTGTNALFSIAGVQKMRSVNHSLRARYIFDDATIESAEPAHLNDNLEYQIQATGQLPLQDPNLLPTQEMVNGRITSIDPQVRQLAMQPKVSGSNGQGALAVLRSGALGRDATGA